MVSLDHEILLELFRNRPSLAPELLRDVMGVAVPDPTTARVVSESLGDVQPAERRADGALIVGQGNDRLGVVLEIQRTFKRQKLPRFVGYVGSFHDRHDVPVALLIVCPDDEVAAAYDRPIVIGPGGSLLRPFVLGPSRIPVVTSAEVAERDPELAVLSALAHGRSPKAVDVAVATLDAISRLDDEDRQRLYLDVVVAALSVAAKSHLEGLMISGYQFKSDFARKYIALGKAEGIGRAIELIALTRGEALTEESAARLQSCTDEAVLEVWLARVARGERVADVVSGAQ